MVALAELVDFKGGGTPSKSIESYWGGNIPWASVKDFKSSELSMTTDFITAEGLKNSASNLILAGNLIVPTRMALGKVAINTIDIAINQDLRALIVKDEKLVDKRYLLRFLESKAKYLESEGKGATVKGITQEVLKELEIPLPPLPEQKRIAAILDKADGLRRKNQQAIQLADQFLRAAFLDMFGDPVTNPKGWDKTPLSELIKVSSGNGLIASQMDINGKFPVYGGNGINGHHSEYMFEEPQLVIGRVGIYCGVIHITEPKAWITDNALYVKEYKQEIDMHFLAESLKQANLNQYAGRAAQPLVSGSRIYPLKVLVPPLDTQKEFSKLKKDFLGLTEKFDNSKLCSEYLFNSLSQKAFAGEL
jgi:type I restriction enzyme S subunit